MSLVREHPRPYGFKKFLKTVAAEVSIERLANDLGSDLRPETANGERRGYGVCHEGDNSTALSVRPSEGVWYCHRCSGGGDILALYMSAHGYDDHKVALIDLALGYGVEPPEPSPKFKARQARQRPLRDGVEEVRAEIVHRRLFRIFRVSYLDGIEDDDLRREEAESVWRDLEPVARGYARRLGVYQEQA